MSSKRDDDSQADMEVGMTTAERRRRRRRGGGLRVPSDNVPRRTATPPVVAPVPEDPALAMSIAYSFGSDATDQLPRVSREIPSFEHRDGSTVVEPPHETEAQADFEMKTREMTAVDLEALGLSDAGHSGSLPLQRSSPSHPLPSGPIPTDNLQVRFKPRSVSDATGEAFARRDARWGESAGSAGGEGTGTSPGEDAFSEAFSDVNDANDVDVDLDGEPRAEDDTGEDPAFDDDADAYVSDIESPPPLRAQSGPAAGERMQIRVPVEPVQHRPPTYDPPSQPRLAPHLRGDEPSQPRLSVTPPAAPVPQPAARITNKRAQTVALSEDDLEEVREATRQATHSLPLTSASAAHVQTPAPFVPAPAPTPGIAQPRTGTPTQSPPPTPSARPADIKSRITAPASVPEIDIRTLEERASGDFEVDVDSGELRTPSSSAVSSSMASSVSGSIAGSIPGAPGAGSGPTAAPAAQAQATASGALSSSISSSMSGTISGTISGPSHSAHTPPPQPVVAPVEPRVRTPSQPPSLSGHPMAPGSGLAIYPSLTPPIAPAPAATVHSQPPPPPSTHSQPPPVPAYSQPPVQAAVHVQPPPMPVPHPVAPPPAPAAAKPPAPPPAKKEKPASMAKPEGKRGKPWFVDLFDEDYLRTLPFLTPQATQAEAEFVIDAMGLTAGAQVLDVGCGYGRHAMELAARGFHVVGLDMSTPLLVRGGEEAHRRGLTINFIRGDMRELDFESQFDGAYCLFSTFGYFDDETNKKTVANIARALKPGGRVLIEILNRDYVIADLPTRVWWEGDGCVVLEEVELNYFSSRICVNRSVVFDDGRQLEQEISVRAYSLHEVGKLLHAAGFRVLEVSGAYHTRGRFFGNQSRHIIVLAERKDSTAA